MNYLDYIEENSTVKIPSIFLFKQFDDVTAFLAHARNANCTVFFENENLTISPTTEDQEKVNIFSTVVSHREIGNAYSRFVWNIDKMSWANVESIKIDIENSRH